MNKDKVKNGPIKTKPNVYNELISTFNKAELKINLCLFTEDTIKTHELDEMENNFPEYCFSFAINSFMLMICGGMHPKLI